MRFKKGDMIRKHYNNCVIEGKVIDFYKNGRYWNTPNSYRLRIIITYSNGDLHSYPIGGIKLINSRDNILLIDRG